MSDLTRAQKTRLGLFLLLAGLIAIGALFIKLGGQIFEHRDDYFTRIRGGVGGLQAGAEVTFNGIVVGRVSKVSVDRQDVAVVRIDLSLDAGTPVPEDTTATVALQGITGLRRVELDGGTNTARRRQPGEEIPAGHSFVDQLLLRAESITKKLDGVLDDAGALVRGDNARHLERMLAHAEAAADAVETLAKSAGPRIDRLLARAEAASADLDLVMAAARDTAQSAQRAAATLERAATHEVEPMLADARRIVARADGVVTRVDGIAAKAESFVGRADSALGRAQSDVRGVLDDLTESLGRIGDLADALRSDPSSLLLGRSAPPRKLP
ncbi:MAG: MlaD family protein [Myxococcota bacterium]